MTAPATVASTLHCRWRYLPEGQSGLFEAVAARGVPKRTDWCGLAEISLALEA